MNIYPILKLRVCSFVAKIIQYDLNDNVRGCIKNIYSAYYDKAIKNNSEIEKTFLTLDELREKIDDYYLRVKDITEKSKKGILVELLPCFEEKQIEINNEISKVYYLAPLTNLLRLNQLKIENEILYISLLKYADGFKTINKIIYDLLGPDRNIVRDKEEFIDVLIERHNEAEKLNSKPLSNSSIIKNARRSINNLITLNIIYDKSNDRSLEDNQIRIKTYIPDYRTLLILYIEERQTKNQVRPSLDTLFNEYDFIKYFFLNKKTISEALKPALEKNLFYFQAEIGDAINEKFNIWEISKK